MIFVLLTKKQDRFFWESDVVGARNSGLRFKGFSPINDEALFDDHYVVYEIVNEKLFTFACLKNNILPKISKQYPILSDI